MTDDMPDGIYMSAGSQNGRVPTGSEDEANERPSMSYTRRGTLVTSTNTEAQARPAAPGQLSAHSSRTQPSRVPGYNAPTLHHYPVQDSFPNEYPMTYPSHVYHAAPFSTLQPWFQQQTSSSQDYGSFIDPPVFQHGEMPMEYTTPAMLPYNPPRNNELSSHIQGFNVGMGQHLSDSHISYLPRNNTNQPSPMMLDHNSQNSTDMIHFDGQPTSSSFYMTHTEMQKQGMETCYDPRCQETQKLDCTYPTGWPCKSPTCEEQPCDDAHCDDQEEGVLCCTDPCPFPSDTRCESPPCHETNCEVASCIDEAHVASDDTYSPASLETPLITATSQHHSPAFDVHHNNPYYSACVDPIHTMVSPEIGVYNSMFDIPSPQQGIKPTPRSFLLTEGSDYIVPIFNTSCSFEESQGNCTSHTAFSHASGGARGTLVPQMTTMNDLQNFSYTAVAEENNHELEPPHICMWKFYNDDGPHSMCRASFIDEEHLQRHIEDAHVDKLQRGGAEKGFLCHWHNCSRYMRQAFNARPKLKRHMQTHSLWKPYTCKICGFKMKTKDAMEKHERTHTGERPYQCTIGDCKKEFATSTELKTHMVVHSGQKPHVCPECGESFADSSNLSKHKKIHFIGMYVCPVKACSRETVRWDQMTRHFRSSFHAPHILSSSKEQKLYKVRMQEQYQKRVDKKIDKTKEVSGEDRKKRKRDSDASQTSQSDHAPSSASLEESSEEGSKRHCGESDRRKSQSPSAGPAEDQSPL